ncbi:hypothetical protein [Mucilaginibacter antarcticus]|uniref:hypothetical protein n=1 Tax=Mucilaginibacter antarcticus TaxID=1855725 RepID=UPI00362C294C
MATSCKSKPDTNADEAPATIKGLYTFEPGAKTFTPCGKSSQFWVVDSSAQLELQYSQTINFEQQGSTVYVEIEGKIAPSAAGTEAVVFDSTLVVKKLIKITKDIPADCK